MNNFSDKELLYIYENSISKKDLISKLKISTNKSGTCIDNEILKYLSKFNITKEQISAKYLKERQYNRYKNEYEKNPKYCLECGCILEYEKRLNKFCSKSCSNAYSNKQRKHSKETKDKISKSLSKTRIANRKDKISICKYCGNEFVLERKPNGRLRIVKYCCKKCHDQAIKEIFHNKVMKEIENGTFIGWKSRNITSYAEKFFVEVLNNNDIKYIREYPLKREHNQSYFLDFYIIKNDIEIDLEIDGKQHKYEDRIQDDIKRDIYVKDKGIKVYRIDWNEIKTENGKQLMKEKIDKFLEFYNNI